MKKGLSVLFWAALLAAAFSCAFAQEGGELSTAASLKAYLPTAGWEDYTARDTDGDGFDDEIMISYDTNGVTALTEPPAWSAACAMFRRGPTR